MVQKTLIPWDFILESIDNESCVVFVGPKLYLDEKDTSLEERFFQESGVKDPDHKLVQSFYEDVGLMLFRRENKKFLLTHQMRNFYKNAYDIVSPSLDKFVQIPFRIIVSLTPDNLLEEAFRQHGFMLNEDVFFKKRPHKPYVKPTKELPFIFKLLGTLSANGDESLILTHNDLFDYMESFFNGKSISEQFLDEISNSRLLLFLGIPFDRWYMQLLLRLLKLHEDLISTATGPIDEPKYIRLYEEQFNIEFVPDKGPQFINQLYERCKESNLLRKKGKAMNIDEKIEGIRSCVREAELTSAFLDLKDLLIYYKPATDDLMDRTTLLEARYQKNSNQMDKGVISNEDYSLANNQIIEAILNILQETKKLLASI